MSTLFFLIRETICTRRYFDYSYYNDFRVDASTSFSFQAKQSLPGQRKSNVVRCSQMHSWCKRFDITFFGSGSLALRLLPSPSWQLPRTSSTFTDCLGYLSLPLTRDDLWSSFFDRPAPKQCQYIASVVPVLDQ